MADDWSVQLEPVDWGSLDRELFLREFLELPDAEEPDADAQRQALGIRLEDRGSARALPVPVKSFKELDVLPDYALSGLEEHGIVAPLPVQAQALPLVLSGCDVVGLAQTGSGKTLAFLLPAVAHIEVQHELARRAATPIALVLAPTRELAVQISEEATKVLRRSREGNHRSGIWAVCLYGGGKKQDQIRNLSWGAHIVVATPGRLIDFVTTKVVSLERVTYFVLDEADRMLDMGFQGDVAALSSQVRPERQVLFFSATWSGAVQELARGLCHGGRRPVRFSVGQAGSVVGSADEMVARQAREGIVQEVVVVDCPGDYELQVAEKQRLLDNHLHNVLNASEEHKILVFVSQKQFADDLATKLWEDGFTAAAMHGSKSQESRLWTLDQFRKGELRLLVATDVIGRGIDIPSVSHVVVYDMGSIDDYVHRIGRTARGAHGRGHALVFFEYWHKDSTIAAQLMEVLAASKQRVPEDLRRIAHEVARGQREVFDANANKWGGNGRWKAGGNAYGRGPAPAAGGDTWGQHNGTGSGTSETPARTQAFDRQGRESQAPVQAPEPPDCWDDA